MPRKRVELPHSESDIVLHLYCRLLYFRAISFHRDELHSVLNLCSHRQFCRSDAPVRHSFTSRLYREKAPRSYTIKLCVLSFGLCVSWRDVLGSPSASATSAPQEFVERDNCSTNHHPVDGLTVCTISPMQLPLGYDSRQMGGVLSGDASRPPSRRIAACTHKRLTTRVRWCAAGRRIGSRRDRSRKSNVLRKPLRSGRRRGLRRRIVPCENGGDFDER